MTSYVARTAGLAAAITLASGHSLVHASANASASIGKVQYTLTDLDPNDGVDALRNKRNTEAIEIAPNTMVSGRVVKYEAAHQVPLADVKARVRERLVAVQAVAAVLGRLPGRHRAQHRPRHPARRMPLHESVRKEPRRRLRRLAVANMRVVDIRVLTVGEIHSHILAHIPLAGDIKAGVRRIGLDPGLVHVIPCGVDLPEAWQRTQRMAHIQNSSAGRGGYSYATASESDAFHSITLDWGDGGVGTRTYDVLRNGVPIASGFASQSA